MPLFQWLCLATATATGFVFTTTTASAWVTSPTVSVFFAKKCTSGTVLRSSHNENDNGWRTASSISISSSSSSTATNNSNSQEYRSIADVVGGLHGGKYQFGGEAGVTGISDSAFSGHGGAEFQTEFEEIDEEAETETDHLPNWAKELAPKEFQTISPLVLSIPSNSNPMDGMVYFASINIQNQERTWEKFHAKIMAKDESETGFVDISADASFSSTSVLSVAPKTGFLAPRGGASNACDASRPYLDTATIRVTQSGDSNSAGSPRDNLWLVVGTEEEQWAYKLDLL